MSNTNTVIVYRNRLEHDFYEGGGAAFMFPLMVAMAVAVASMMLVQKFSSPRTVMKEWYSTVLLTVGATSGAGVFWWMI